MCQLQLQLTGIYNHSSACYHPWVWKFFSLLGSDRTVVRGVTPPDWDSVLGLLIPRTTFDWRCKPMFGPAKGDLPLAQEGSCSIRNFERDLGYFLAIGYRETSVLQNLIMRSCSSEAWLRSLLFLGCMELSTFSVMIGASIGNSSDTSSSNSEGSSKPGICEGISFSFSSNAFSSSSKYSPLRATWKTPSIPSAVLLSRSEIF